MQLIHGVTLFKKPQDRFEYHEQKFGLVTPNFNIVKGTYHYDQKIWKAHMLVDHTIHVIDDACEITFFFEKEHITFDTSNRWERYIVISQTISQGKTVAITPIVVPNRSPYLHQFSTYCFQMEKGE